MTRPSAPADSGEGPEPTPEGAPPEEHPDELSEPVENYSADSRGEIVCGPPYTRHLDYLVWMYHPGDRPRTIRAKKSQITTDEE